MQRVSRQNREVGKGTLTTVVGAAVAVLAVFVVYQAVPFYYYNFDLKNHMQRAIGTAGVETDEEIRRDLMAVVKRHGITCGDRDLQVVREGDTISLALHYVEPLSLSLFGRDITLHSFEFDATAKGRFR